MNCAAKIPPSCKNLPPSITEFGPLGDTCNFLLSFRILLKFVVMPENRVMCQVRCHAFFQTETDTLALQVWWSPKEHCVSSVVSFDYRIVLNQEARDEGLIRAVASGGTSGVRPPFKICVPPYYVWPPLLHTSHTVFEKCASPAAKFWRGAWVWLRRE